MGEGEKKLCTEIFSEYVQIRECVMFVTYSDMSEHLIAVGKQFF